MGDTDALRDKLAQDIATDLRRRTGPIAQGAVFIADIAADAVLPVVTAALSSLRSRVEALADELDGEATETTPLRADDLRALAQRLRRSFLPQEGPDKEGAER